MMTEADDSDQIVVRRLLHLSLGLILVYYLFPKLIFGVPKEWYVVILFMVLPITLEIIRILTKGTFYGMRKHEKGHVASYVWFTSGAVILIVLFPQSIAAPCILAAAIGDPVLGATRDLRRRHTFSITYMVIFLIFYLFHYHLVIGFVAAGIVLISESVEFRIKWQLRPHLFYSRSQKKVSRYKRFFEVLFRTDDDFMMQIIPALSLLVIFTLIGWQYMPPELIHIDPEIARYV
jgi:dolichol kinase